MKNKVLMVLVIMLFTQIFLPACTKTTSNMVSDFNDYVVEKVVKKYEDGDVRTTDIAIEYVYHGSFSRNNGNEIFVICKILNTPHVAGLDKTVCVLLDADSLEIVAYKEFAADKVEIRDIQTSNGQKKILVLQTTTYQGISTQEIHLFTIQDGQWKDIPIEFLRDLNDEYFYFIEDDMIIVASDTKLTSLKDIIAVLIWNPDTEQYVLVQ